MAQSEQDALTERLGRYPLPRYPVQHATTQFHLGSVLLHVGEVDAAQACLTVARNVFAGTGMRLEQAKATIMLGVALRLAGRLDEAQAAFTAAGTAFSLLDQAAEQAAASYNLGLVSQDRGDSRGAYTAWTTARELFLAAGHPAQAAAAARDHGGSLLTAGDVAAAVSMLSEAVTLAQRADDRPGCGAAGNTLGLAYLAGGDPNSAVEALRDALVSFPRSVRPAEHAMVKANLALAYEQANDPARAHLAAGQALAFTSAAAPVRQQARQVLSRLPGPAYTALLRVLDDESPEQRVPVLRAEVLRLVEAPATGRDREVRGLLDGLLARPGTCYEFAEGLLTVVLELPPASYTTLIAALVEGTGRRTEQDADRLRAVFSSAMARFALPQWQRIAASLNAAAATVDQPAQWR